MITRYLFMTAIIARIVIMIMTKTLFPTFECYFESSWEISIVMAIFSAAIYQLLG